MPDNKIKSKGHHHGKKIKNRNNDSEMNQEYSGVVRVDFVLVEINKGNDEKVQDD